MSRIIILGERGMLGQMALRYFKSRGAEVLTVLHRFDFTAQCPALASLAELGPGLVLNCVGRIKQKSATRSDLFDVNAVLPAQIYERLGARQFLVQPSTDCVYSGLSEVPYSKTANCDATDEYGWSKRLGEVALLDKPNAAIVRVSIIGPDLIDPEPKGLLGWFLHQTPGTKLQGYRNHFWNGITTLQWCREVEKLFVDRNPTELGGKLIQLGTEEIHSKCGMLELFQSVYGTNHSISPTEHPDRIQRALVPDHFSPPLIDQLMALKAYS